jgi:hypothetical protein
MAATRTRKPASPVRGKAKIKTVMREYKRGALRSSSGAKVRSRKQAVAIALSEARDAGARIPGKRSSGGRRTRRRRASG